NSGYEYRRRTPTGRPPAPVRAPTVKTSFRSGSNAIARNGSRSKLMTAGGTVNPPGWNPGAPGVDPGGWKPGAPGAIPGSWPSAPGIGGTIGTPPPGLGRTGRPGPGSWPSAPGPGPIATPPPVVPPAILNVARNCWTLAGSVPTAPSMYTRRLTRMTRIVPAVPPPSRVRSRPGYESWVIRLPPEILTPPKLP